ncbi:8068_t:CDS:1, partial [Ambispora gerdemannii]
ICNSNVGNCSKKKAIEVSAIKNGERPSPVPNDIMFEYQRIMDSTMDAITQKLHVLRKKIKSRLRS